MISTRFSLPVFLCTDSSFTVFFLCFFYKFVIFFTKTSYLKGCKNRCVVLFLFILQNHVSVCKLENINQTSVELF